MLRTALLAALLWLAGPLSLVAQERVQTPILTLNQEALYARSLFGQRVEQELQRASEELAAENRRIEAALVAEEAQLTEDRPTMDPAAFRELAEDFDERVTGIRRAQADKRASLQRIADSERTRFFELAYPVLLRMVEEIGALAILDQSAIIIAARLIDVTETAIARVDAEIGAAPLPEEAPGQPEPRPAPDAEEAPSETTTEPAQD